MADDYAELLRAAQESENIIDSKLDEDLQNFSTLEISVSDHQYSVITHPHSLNEILSVRAGPGSGKTFTVSARIAHLLSEGMEPSQILVLSMANRSVDALRQSLGGIIGEELANQVEISTFHSFCGSIVDQYAPILQPLYARRRIFDKQSWNKLARLFLNKNISLGDYKLGGQITAVKLDKLLMEVTNGDLSPAQAAHKYNVNANYIETLVQYLQKYGVMRYSDLVTNAISLMNLSLKSENGGFMARVGGYRAVFVDEFQDMYPLLMSVVRAIVNYPTLGETAKAKHLTICGDQNQSIYEFLGASHKSMANITRVFPNMKVSELPLLESFRCVQPILDAAYQICLDPQEQVVDRLVLNRTTDLAVKPILVQHGNQESEIKFIADEIVRLICCLGGLIFPEDVAILTRTNAEAERVQAVLKDGYGIKSNKISQGNLWVLSPMHIYRDILSVISGESDSSFSLLNLLSILDKHRGVELRAYKIFNASIAGIDEKPTNFLETFLFDELVKVEHKEKGLLGTVYKKYPEVLENLALFLNQVQLEREKLNTLHSQSPLAYNPLQLSVCLKRMAELPGIREFVFKDEGKDIPYSTYLKSFNNSLHNSFENFADRADLNGMTFVDYFLQTYDNEIPVKSKKMVQVSTIHSAKGLEFPIVFILGRSKYSSYWDSYLAPDGAEPRHTSNLLYVALTRARDLVYLGSAEAFVNVSPVAQQTFQDKVPDLGVTTEGDIEDITRDLGARVQISPAYEGENKELEDNHTREKLCNVAFANNAAQFVNSLSKDLHRPVPLREKLKNGFHYYRDIMNVSRAHVTPDLHLGHSGLQFPLSKTGIRQFLGVINQSKRLVRRL